MSIFITAVPLFDAEMSVQAYRLKSRDGERLLGLKDDHTALSGATDSPAIETVNEVGIEAFTGGKPLFIDVNQFHVLGNVPQSCTAPKELLFFVISSDTIDDADCLAKCQELKEMGYGIALEHVERAERLNDFLPLADYVMLDTSHRDFSESMKAVVRHDRNHRLVLSDIPSMETFSQLKRVQNSLYEGRFYNQPLTAGKNVISPLKLNALQLLRLIGEDDFELEDASKIIRKDPAISIALLRFINSPSIGIISRITSITSAVALLGQKETKKWISAAISIKLSEDKPSEITKLSLIRAKFAENLANYFEMGVHSQSLFLMGLFSLLDVILEKPMEQALKEVSVDKHINEALVSRSGQFFDVLDLIYNYERAEWESVLLVMIRRSLKAESIEKAFIDALNWYGELLASQIELQDMQDEGGGLKQKR